MLQLPNLKRRIQDNPLLNGQKRRLTGNPQVDSTNSALIREPLPLMGAPMNRKFRVPALIPSDWQVGTMRRKANNLNMANDMEPTYEPGSSIPGLKSAPGMPTNGKYTYARTCPVSKRPFYSDSKVDQLVFVKRLPSIVDEFPFRRVKDAYLIKDRNILVNLAGVNYMLAFSEQKVSDRDQVRSVHEAVNDWSVEGVVRNENLDAGSMNANKERTVNCYIRGSQIHMHTLWPEDRIIANRRAFVILKRVKVDREMFHLDHSDRDPYPSVRITEMDKDKEDIINQYDNLVERPFQYVPYISEAGLDRVPDCELEYEDDFGIKSMGIPIYIGAIERMSSRAIEKKTQEQIMTDITAGDKTAKIFLYFDPSV